MKKIFKYIPFLIITMFLTLNVEAKTVMVDYNSNEMFNYFYEEKNNTAFYRYLLSHQSNLYDTLKEEYSKLSDYLLSLFLVSEFSDTSDLKEGTAYVILGKERRFYGNSCSDNYYNFFISYDDNSLKLGTTGTYCHSGANTFFGLGDNILFMFDENASYLGYKKVENISNKINGMVDGYFEFNLKSDSDFSYFLSKTYYTPRKFFYSDSSTAKPDLIVNRYRLDDKLYYIDDNENYSDFIKRIKIIFSFGYAKNADVSDTYLEYFKTYKYITSSSGANPLYTILNYKQSSQSLPSNFTSVSFDTNGNILLIPKKKVNDDNSKVYMSSTGTPRLQLNFFEIKEDKTLNLLTNYKRNVKITKTNSIGYLNLYSSSKLGPLPSKNYYDYVYWISNLEQFNKKDQPLQYEVSLYFDPNYYDYKFITYPIEDYTLSIFGDNYSLTKEMIEGANFSGASVDIFADPKYQQSMAEEEGFWGKDNIIGNIDSVYGTVTNSAISMLSLVTLTFAALPVEIKTIFILSLVVGFLILLKKLISG